MSKSRRDRLIELGPESLADLLLEIARDSESAEHKLMRMISSKSENISLFKQKLNELVGNERRFIPWKYSSEFADEVSDLLQDIKKGASTPQEGLCLVVEFFKADEKLFEMVDDSSGHLGTVFTCDAFDLFREYAKQIEDNSVIIDAILGLLENDNYGVRDCVLDEAYHFLDKSDLKKLFEAVLAKSKEYTGKHDPWGWKLTSIAKQMKDGPLFEKLTREKLGDRVNSKFLVEMASVYFESGAIEKAQSLIDSISDDDSFADYDRRELQKRILHKTNKTGELTELLTKQFKDHYCEITLKELLTVVGQDKRKEICRQAINDILSSKEWNPSHAEFVIYCEAYDETEKYVLKHATSLDGDRYYSLLPVARAMEKNKKYLIASLIFRALLNSILSRGKSKTYDHGVDYLHKLERLNMKITDWSAFSTHIQYFQALKEAHSRKTGFWRRYSENIK